MLSASVVALIMVQAVLAGRSLFGTASITVHGALGNVTFAAVLATIATAVIGRLGRQAVVVAVVLALVVTAQVGLGYAGREITDAAAWHIPNGVLAFGLAVHQLGLGVSRRRR